MPAFAAERFDSPAGPLSARLPYWPATIHRPLRRTQRAGQVRLPAGFTTLDITLGVDPHTACRALLDGDVDSLRVQHLFDDSCRFLRGMPSLRQVALGTNATDRAALAVAELKQLERLHLIGDGLSDEGLQCLARLRSLTRLQISSPIVTDSGMAALISSLPNLQVVTLDGGPGITAGLLTDIAVPVGSLEYVHFRYCPWVARNEVKSLSAGVGIQATWNVDTFRGDRGWLQREAPWGLYAEYQVPLE